MMNPLERAELERLKRRQLELQEHLTRLDTDLKLLAEKLEIPPAEINPMEVSPLDVPPLLSPAPEQGTPGAVPPVIPQPVIPPQRPIPFIPPVAPVKHEERRQFEEPTPPPVPPIFNETTEAPLELKLGTYWLVRIGVVVLLTGLVFLGNYAYENFAGRFGAAGKLAMLYLASGVLVGLGAWFQRPKQQATLKNYGQVVFAGGLAAAYFTTYAAHHIPSLQIIKSAVVDGLLLLCFAGFIFWFADRRKSQVLALFAIGLAYYTSIITTVGLFTLYSNLILSIAAVLFLVRNRWATISFASMAGTYLAYVFWRFHDPGGWLWAARNGEFWMSLGFLTAYWVVFTAAIFPAREERMTSRKRAIFLTLNNGAYFGLVVLSMIPYYREHFWQFAVLFGAVLLVCAAFMRRLSADDNSVRMAYLAQGLVILTIGFVAHFTGFKLGLILAGQSVILFVLSTRHPNVIMRTGSFIAAALAAHAAINWQLRDGSELLAASVGVLLFFNAFWSHRRESLEPGGFLRPVTSFFSLLAMAIWFVATWRSAGEDWRAPLLAVEAIAFTLAFHVWRCREVTVLGQLFLVIAQLSCLVNFLDGTKPAWWSPAIVVGTTLALSHWWQFGKAGTEQEGGVRKVLLAVYALAAMGVLYTLLKPYFSPEPWLAVTALLALVLLLYGIGTRAWEMAIASQLFAVISVWELLGQLALREPRAHLAIVPVAVLFVISLGLSAWVARRGGLNAGTVAPISQASRVYRWIALVLSMAWIYEYVAADFRFAAFSVVATLVFLWAGWRKSHEGMLASGAYFFVGYLLFFAGMVANDTALHWPNLMALLALPILQQVARRPNFYALPRDLQIAMILLGGIGLWIEVSRWVIAYSVGGRFLLTVTWAGFALVVFAAGLLLRERMYRWLGLVVLGCAVGRVFLSDVWKLQTVYRILSFMALGVVLLVLGFLYNKFQHKIREWI